MILITGADGQLGRDVAKEAKARGISILCTDKGELDITDEKSVMNFLELHRPDAVIHCAAFTDVNGAESNAELCMKINAYGAGCVAKACEKVGTRMIYISTDYVFDGNNPNFYETDCETNPLSAYGRSKLEGEKLVRKYCSRSYIVRTSWLFGGTNKNFILTMLKLAIEKDAICVVADQFGSPTYTVDLARLLVDMALTDKYGTYHATNEGFCSWYELASEALSCAECKAKAVPICSKDFPAPAKRPLNSCLSKDCLDRNGFKRLPDWRNAVKRYIYDITK